MTFESSEAERKYYADLARDRALAEAVGTAVSEALSRAKIGEFLMSHEGLPVSGYKPQTDASVKLVNENKRLEERVLRQVDMMSGRTALDQRMVALARTQIQAGFMWLNRAVFQPGRVSLPEDETGA